MIQHFSLTLFPLFGFASQVFSIPDVIKALLFTELCLLHGTPVLDYR